MMLSSRLTLISTRIGYWCLTGERDERDALGIENATQDDYDLG